jgi:beta-galactosidase
LEAPGNDLRYILVEAIDAAGYPIPLAANPVTFNVEGPGEILGVANGDPLSTESFRSRKCSLFYGKALLIIRVDPRPSAANNVTASSPLLKSATVSLQAASR